MLVPSLVALRKESVDRNMLNSGTLRSTHVALRKESVDRNPLVVTAFPGSAESLSARRAWIEISYAHCSQRSDWSLSARRAWIEIFVSAFDVLAVSVALRKESVDRNVNPYKLTMIFGKVALRKESVDRNAYGRRITRKITLSLSARRAWIEMFLERSEIMKNRRRSPQGERG